MKSPIGNLMKQAQKMQEEMQKAQEELAHMIIEGQAGGGLVSVIMNGKHEAQRVKIDPSLLTEDQDMLEDLITAAINDAHQKIETETQERFSNMASGIQLPPGMSFPF